MPEMKDRMDLYNQLRRFPHLEISAVVTDPYHARDLIVVYRPDLLILGLELPRMPGLEFLNVLDRFWPIPSIAITKRLKETPQLEALAKAKGAIAVFQRPPEGMRPIADQIPDLVSRMSPRNRKRTNYSYDKEMVIAIGASTGGTVALRSILSETPDQMPPILIVQHMPKKFTTLFAASLNNISSLNVVELTSRLALRNNTVILAPGNRHMVLERRGGALTVSLLDSAPVRNHKPSVDVLFQSVASVMKEKAIGVILTGMGSDGADGLLAMRMAGAYTIAQDETSCAVYGMPREAVARGAVHATVPLSYITNHITDAVKAFFGGRWNLKTSSASTT